MMLPPRYLCLLFRSVAASLAVATLLGTTACIFKDYSKAKDFLDVTLQGNINGDEWVYKHAYVDPTIETPEEDFVFVFLPYKPKADCPTEGAASGDERILMVAAPKQKRKKAVRLRRGTSRSLVFQFVKGDEQMVTAALRGKVELTSIGKRVVKGRLLGRASSKNWVNGTFTATICDIAEMRAPRSLAD